MCAHNSDCIRLHFLPLFLLCKNTFSKYLIHHTDHHRFDPYCLRALARMKERGWLVRMIRWPSLTFKSTWHTLYGSFYPLNHLILISKLYRQWKFPTTLSAKVVGKGIQFPWHGVLYRSVPMSKSLGNQMGQCDLFLNSNQQVSK